MELRVSLEGWRGMKGKIDLRFNAETVTLCCRVPVDEYVDDWFEAVNRFDRWVYEEAIAALSLGEPVTIPGRDAGHFALAPLASGRIRMCISNGSQELVSDINLRPQDLLPSVDLEPGRPL